MNSNPDLSSVLFLYVSLYQGTQTAPLRRPWCLLLTLPSQCVNFRLRPFWAVFGFEFGIVWGNDISSFCANIGYTMYCVPYNYPKIAVKTIYLLESRQRRTKGSVVGEEWCQNAAPLRWYTKNVFAQSKMILSRAWLHDTVSCAAWNDARKGVYLKPLFKTPCSNCYWGWSIPIMLDYRDISLMESVPLMWGPVTASPVGIEPMTIFGGGPLIIDIQYITARIPWIPRAGPPIPPKLVLKHGELR